MSIFRKLKQPIPPPYSTIISLSNITLVGIFLLLYDDKLFLFGVGIILGGFTSIIVKKACEISERETWNRIRAFFQGKNYEDRDNAA